MEFTRVEFETAERTPDEVRKVIKTAKLHESELTDITQVLRFAEQNVHNLNLKLMLLDDNLLQEIEAGNQLIFKGDVDENAVLCTQSRTYDIKEAETSNSLHLVPDLLFAASTDDGRPPRSIVHKDILNTFFTYYEVKPCKPRLLKLQKLLEETSYRGLELEYEVDKTKLLTYEGIFDVIQASRAELDEELVRLQALKIGEHYRLLDFDYEFRILSYMLDLIEENSWPLNKISREVTLDSLKDLVPACILEAMFGFYTMESVEEGGTQYYQYKEDKVCRFLARVLLKSAGKFNLVEFMQAWRDSVPEGMITHKSMLAGIAITDESSQPPVIWGFSASDLPEDLNQRFKILFQAKPKWTLSEISPYIELYATEKLNVNALLTKYARASAQDGVRVFSAKHMK
ncbi:hypothetical protein KGM_202562 [Danaus plexippus plexippus]|uniref:Sister chromatid cohesion protein DCC1 n=1 Tax=Danaus plexippus plexippus TaxID=278856 RepID=A0A212ESP5_DANPL|nr:hypothetical protein KGM_202562 [Danaus plexippus plexippus]